MLVNYYFFLVLEVAIGEYGPVVDLLKLESSDPTEGKKPGNGFYFPNFSLEELKEGIKRRRRFKSGKSASEASYENSFFFEFYYLYMRNLILLQRSYVSITSKNQNCGFFQSRVFKPSHCTVTSNNDTQFFVVVISLKCDA